MSQKQTPNNNILEYVLSGTSFTRLNFKEAWELPDTYSYVKAAFDKMQTFGYDFGLLYNAYAESGFGKNLNTHFLPNLSNIYADSGGLQVITKGSKITPELKSDVYKNQAAYSTIAMSFDEIPLTTSKDTSSRLDHGSRWFDHSRVEPCAVQSGKNLLEQIEYFIKAKTVAKPLMICQGNDYDSFMKWTELLAKQIPRELHEYIGGIALSSASHGHGALEEIERAFFYTQLPIELPRKHLHLLGVGAVTRMLPTMVFVSNGVYQDTRISFDSTTHSSAPHFGRYVAKHDKTIFFNRYLDPVVNNAMYNDVREIFDLDFTPEAYFDSLVLASMKFGEKYGTRDICIRGMVTTTLKMVYNFMECVKALDSKSAIVKFARKSKTDNAYASLYEVKTKSDFDYWHRHVGPFVESDRVNSEQPTSLDDFFS